MARFWTILLAILPLAAFSQKGNPFGLPLVNDVALYQQAIVEHTENELVEIKKVIPTIILDIRYATKNNFMGQRMYSQARAFARKPVVVQLQKIQSYLQTKGLGLKIFDAYRPYAVTLAFYEKATDKNFVADPAKGSRHNRGCAIDLTLVDLRTKKELPMPTAYDSFTPAAAADYKPLPPLVEKNRDFLIKTMRTFGFKVIQNEWWHYDFIGWENYSLVDIPFEKL